MIDHAALLLPDVVPVREMDRDELSGVITAVHSKFPDRTRDEVGDVVRSAYRHLAHNATVTSHLIPLTLNRSMRLMRIARNQHRDSGLGEPVARLSTMVRHAGRS